MTCTSILCCWLRIRLRTWSFGSQHIVFCMLLSFVPIEVTWTWEFKKYVNAWTWALAVVEDKANVWITISVCQSLLLHILKHRYLIIQERKSIRPTFSVERVFGGVLLAMCTNDFICFYDWADCRLIRRIDVNVKVSLLCCFKNWTPFSCHLMCYATNKNLLFSCRTSTGLTVVIWWQLQVIHHSTFWSTMWVLLRSVLPLYSL